MPIDMQALEKLKRVMGGGDEDLRELIESFLEEAPTLITALEHAYAEADHAGARRAAHSLKSNARDMGAMELGETCACIEGCYVAGNLPAASDIGRAKALHAQAAIELSSMLRRGA
ncbi:Hpt domain-containing protein [Rhizobium sp. KVB221]|uniref:Hpt domain-containing protein n=1 Tax=Rhizobium setariae TaxID=2801340 RepID=A0A936YWP1_9HYPH|nr:Hpt domain-containing protein [Rhizobium setariae]MBL0375297.1 Hpt domain-containing protein [Rhizobium setariae]